MNNIGPTVANTATTSFRFSNMIAPIVGIALAILALIVYVAVRVRRTRATREMPLDTPQTQQIQAVQRRQLSTTNVWRSTDSSASFSLNSSPTPSPVRSMVPPSRVTTFLTELEPTSISTSAPKVAVIEPISQEVIDAALGKIREGQYQEAAEGIERGYPFEEGVVLAAALRAIGNKMSEKDKVKPLGEQKVKLAAMTLVQEMLSDENLQRTKKSTTRDDIESIISESFSETLERLTQAMQYETPSMSFGIISSIKGMFAGTAQSMQKIHRTDQMTGNIQDQESPLISLQVGIVNRFAQICEEVVRLEESAIQQRIASFN